MCVVVLAMVANVSMGAYCHGKVSAVLFQQRTRVGEWGEVEGEGEGEVVIEWVREG